MTDSDSPLEATRFQPQVTVTASPTQADAAGAPRWLLPAIGITAVLLVLVVWVLPKVIESEPAAGLTDTNNLSLGSQSADTPSRTAPDATQSANNAVSERSPFAEAQLQKQRRAAQEALQRVLELQEILQELRVEMWALDAYKAAIAIAEAGDEAYRTRDFEQASGLYLSASEALLDIEASVPGRITQTQKTIVAAVEAGDISTAESALATLNVLAPDEASTEQLAARVAAIPTVITAMEAAKTAFEQESYAQAVSEIEAAVTADAQHQGAKQALDGYRSALRNAQFRKAMGQGYDALDTGAFDAARQAFVRAETLRPGAPEIVAARVELETAETRAILLQLQNQAREHEQAEDWQAALESYQKAQAIDESVVFAQDGIARSGPRLALAKALTEIVEQSERLVDTRLLAQAGETVKAAKAIANPGSVLLKQIDEAQAAISYASTPVSLTVTSDGLTDITLLRVKRLGSFAETALTLRPGEYTAMGVRNGFRDVRVTFTVTPDRTEAVDVRCVEPI